jgi:BirA family biotin operon repressor/biotin-[acetyl-CoA-carboxylase] ligase
MVIHSFDSLESTNKYCEALDLTEVEDFTCYWALEQTAGIGQRGNHWHSAPGQNLTFSLVLHPTFLPAARQFQLTQALSLGVMDFIDNIVSIDSIASISPIASIKWPNDIYIDDHKICGTLVSTRLQSNAIASAVCGIGLNVNEREFPSWVPHPTSLGLLTGQEYDLEPLLYQLLVCIERRYNDLKSGLDPEPEYLAYLMNLHVPARYIYNKEEITATITGVDPHGRLLLSAADGRSLSCGMKEIQFVL